MPRASRDQNGMVVKKCGCCKRNHWHPTEEDLRKDFYRDKTRKDGFSNHCIECHMKKIYGTAQLQPTP